MTTIEHPYQLGGELYDMILLEKGDDPQALAGDRKAYLFDSKIIKATYLFVEVE